MVLEYITVLYEVVWKIGRDKAEHKNSEDQNREDILCL